MRLIDADELKERLRKQSLSSNREWLQMDLDLVIDNAPTVEIPVARWDCYCEGQKVGYEKALSEMPQGEFTRKELECWLYRIADHNFGNELGRSCEEIISRLDGFERFASDMRKGEVNDETN